MRWRLGRRALPGPAEPCRNQRKSLVRADHLALLHTRWADHVRVVNHERYRRLVQDALPQEWRGKLSPQATWIYRTMKAAELAGLDAGDVVRAAVRSRPLDGARDVASVLDATKPLTESKLAEPPEWVIRLAEQRHAFQEKLEERQNVMIPDEDPDRVFLGQAWPWQDRDPDCILQPPKPELRPCSGVERLAVREIPDREAGG